MCQHSNLSILKSWSSQKDKNNIERKHVWETSMALHKVYQPIAILFVIDTNKFISPQFLHVTVADNEMA